MISSEGETENSYLYCGEQFDNATGLYYLRARYMDPSTGTFVSMDTYQGSIFDPVSLHKYLYANANPVMNVDPSGYFAMAAGLAVSSIIDAEQRAYDAFCIAVGMALITALNQTLIQYRSQISELVFNMAEDTEGSLDWSISDWWERLKEKIRSKSDAIDIDATGERKEGDQLYYHATTLNTAIIIMASMTLMGSPWEGGYVFAWRRMPNRKALNLSGAKSAEVIVAFSTFAAFNDDWGITDKYVMQFQPVCSCFPGPVRANKVVIMPIV